MAYQEFWELPVYIKARHLRKRVYELVKKLPAHEEYNLKLQMRKAATSVTNNIAEGNGRYYYQENIHFCRRSRGSVNEILDDLTLCVDRRT
jgi:four helix bundle protein